MKPRARYVAHSKLWVCEYKGWRGEGATPYDAYAQMVQTRMWWETRRYPGVNLDF